jgi:hypothetical protein
MHVLGEGTPVTGATPEYPVLNAIRDILTSIGPTVGQVIGQIKLIDLNTELIRQGKAPLTAAQAQAISPQINVGVSQNTMTSLMLILGIGGAVLLLSRR